MVLSIDDPRLVESFRAGENEAFEALVRAHRPALYRHALRKLSDHAAAEDAVQETFTRAYKSRARVGDDWRLGAWLHQILANVCIDEANRRKRESTKASRWASTEVNSHGLAPSLEDQLGLDADHADVVRALRELPDNYQEALELRYVAELEYDEMADVLSLSEENVRARVSRANKAIRVLLRPVAAIIAFFAAFSFRRGGRSGRAVAATHDLTTAVNTTTSLAPLVETAQAIAIQAPHAMPLISKAAVGLGMLVVATAPATAPVVIDELRGDDPPAASTPVGSVAIPASDEQGEPIDVTTPVVGSEETPASDVDTPIDTIAPGVIEFGTQSAIEAGAGSDVGFGEEADSESSDSVEVVSPSTPPLVESNSGLTADLTSSTLSVAPSGPRFDISGEVSLAFGERQLSGPMTGRLNIVADADAQGRRRLDGSFAVSTAEGTVSFVVVGYAVADDLGSYSLSGRFRSSAGDLELPASGSFAGWFGSAIRLAFSA